MGLVRRRFMSLRRRRRRRQQQRARNASIVSSAGLDKRKGSPCQQDNDDDNSHARKIMRTSIPDLPEDLWRRIHSLMPMRDAARAACLFWRCYPNLTLTKYALGSELKGNTACRINCIMRNHSGVGVKILELGAYEISRRYFDSWLQFAVAPGIEKLKVRNSIRDLEIVNCAFRPTSELGPFRSLANLILCYVHITSAELECLLSNSHALEKLELFDCNEIRFLEIPCVLQQLSCLRIQACRRLQVMENKAPKLSCLRIQACRRLQVIENKAPKLSCVYLSTRRDAELLLGEATQMKKLTMYCPYAVSYACAQVLPIMPNLETLVLGSEEEVVPMLPTKFLNLKHLEISLTSGWTFPPSYDYFSLVSFLDASPVLETLFLDVSQELMEHESVSGDPSHLRQIPEHHHCCLKSVEITRFSSAKSLVELTCYILKNAVSLECLTLDTLYGSRCSDKNSRSCTPFSTCFLRQACGALVAIRTYIEDKVPSTVKLRVMEPCRQCHAPGGCSVGQGPFCHGSFSIMYGAAPLIIKVSLRDPSKMAAQTTMSLQGKLMFQAATKDLWRHIHSLMPMRDAARAACLSRAFLQFWRCYPNLTLTKYALGSELKGNTARIINCIMRNHSGVGVKILELGAYEISGCYFDSWLQFAVAPGIEKLKVRNSIRDLEIVSCAFRPTTELGPFRSLANLILCYVHITSDELECLLSNSHALEKLELFNCKEIRFLEIPCVLQQLSCLRIQECRRLQVIENKAPKLSRVYFSTRRNAELLLGEATQMKKLTMYCPYAVSYACAEMLPIMPNLETLVLGSEEEVVNTPMLPTKFLNLKHLEISLTSGWTFPPSYDYFSLVSFLDAFPALETLFLDVSQELMEHESVSGDPSHLRQIPEHHHCCLKSVEITGFSSAKSLVELTCYIIKNAVSLECLTLDTLCGSRCSDENSRRCDPFSTCFLRQARGALVAIRTYIEDKVPSTVKLRVMEPCSQCHAPGGLHGAAFSGLDLCLNCDMHHDS
ncbi:hypothetical protein U9M48_014344 [Paspalum notatum var. saurae]|uniref:At1g61320/AtMIF1 LRR domain-containing protein n=1 Tax=Paspalum notatum var. saurae TaxID=547442 RepID=A0AAQ3T2N6_PASNO